MVKGGFIKTVWAAFKKSKVITKIGIAIFIVAWVFCCVITLSNTHYVCDTPGSVDSASSNIYVNGGSTNIFTIGVYEDYNLSKFQYWVAQKEASFSLELFDSSSQLSEKDENTRGTYLKGLAEINAVIAAYDAAIQYETDNGLTPTVSYDKTYKGIMCTAVLPSAITDLEMGDIVTKINGQEFSSYTEFKTLLWALIENKPEYNVKFELTIVRDDEEKTISNTIVYNATEKNYSFGVELFDYYTISNPNPTFNVKTSGSMGSSGGAMITLSLYQSLLADYGDVTKNYTIAGTGTIDADGNVGEIACITQKVYTLTLPNYSGVEIFFCPVENYEEALQAKESSGATFEIVKVATFTDILNYLNTLPEKESA